MEAQLLNYLWIADLNYYIASGLQHESLDMPTTLWGHRIHVLGPYLKHTYAYQAPKNRRWLKLQEALLRSKAVKSILLRHSYPCDDFWFDVLKDNYFPGVPFAECADKLMLYGKALSKTADTLGHLQDTELRFFAAMAEAIRKVTVRKYDKIDIHLLKSPLSSTHP